VIPPMTAVSRSISECIFLPSKEILQKFKTGDFPDKTFSRLYAHWIGIPTTQALVMEFRGKKFEKSYCAIPDIEDFLTRYQYYIIVYDFRAQFEDLELWMKKRQVRPRPVKCTRADVVEHIEECIERGGEFTDDFFIHVNVRFLQYNHMLCTVNGDRTYIECSEDFDTAHGKEGAQLCIVQKGSVLLNETSIPDGILVEAAHYTEKLTAFVGDNTTCEFSLVDGNLYFYTGQRSSRKIVTIPFSRAHTVRVVSPGTVKGTLKRVDRTSIPDVVSTLSETNQKYVFLAEKPYSEFVDLLKFAKGFIFNEGSMLCHLAIVLREKGIPARIIPHTDYEDGISIILE